MAIKVAKFGGSSLADAAQFRKVKDILLADPSRRYAVPSAPGKRFKDDTKVTDLLYQCYRQVEKGDDMQEVFSLIEERYRSIASDLSLDIDIDGLLDQTCADIRRVATPDFAASRGEYLNGVLLSAYLGWDFIDPRDYVKFDRQGVFAEEWTNELLGQELKKHEYAVIPGFYGSVPNGEVRTFSRGGSDITGAVVARAAGADLYENWTDVSGFLMADPRIVDHPKEIRCLTYAELRELSYMGATVLHEESIFPVHKAGIPTNIRNTNDPAHPGTMILDKPQEATGIITGIAGHKNFSLLSIEKAMLNSEKGFCRKVLSVLEDFDISIEHMPTGIDTVSVVVADSEIKNRQSEIIHRIRELCQPDHIDISTGIALIATVGIGMVRSPGTAARLFGGLHKAGVNVRMIDQGSSELNIIVGVDTQDFEKAVKAIYEAFNS
ncbi:MAG: aspartate kinase [Clostridia bacterium]|nr:aspartate kinase [Clostridia bacterium]